MVSVSASANDTPHPPGAPGSAPPVAAARCGRLPGEPIVPTKWGFSANLGGGNDCDAIATIWANVAHADRACRADADCVAIAGNGHCFEASLNQGAAKQTRYAKTPCGNPMAGPCVNRGLTPRCNAGCCEMSP